MMGLLQQFVLITVAVIVFTTAVNSELCYPIEKDCSFYSHCLEEAVPCGPDGYALGYGKKYCQKFKDNYTRFSPRGRDWVWSTMSCLQKVLVPVANGQVNMTCDEIRSFAYGSHPVCYTQPGNSICNLPFTDWALLSVIILQELGDPATWEQLSAVIQTCRRW